LTMEYGKEDEIPAKSIPEFTPNVFPEVPPQSIPEIDPKDLPEIPEPNNTDEF
jgi:hypothetical protein